MEDYIKRGIIEFITLAPVYIGCGQAASKKEYLYDAEKGKIEILQMGKVFDRICRLGLEKEFEEYLLTPVDNRGGRGGPELVDFMHRNRIPEREYRTWSDEVLTFADSKMNYRSIKDISLFARNERGLPYVPASGFKGMLRTVLETEHYLKNREGARELGKEIIREVDDPDPRRKRRDKFLKEQDSRADVESMHKEMFEPQRKDERPGKNLSDQKNDILRGFLVGDSRPLSWDDMCICEKIDLNLDGEERLLNVQREAIRPGVKIKIPIRIDTRICRYTLPDIVDAIKSFDRNYRDVFSSHFTAVPPTGDKYTTFFLGGGTGYVSKTIIYGILEGKEAVETVSKITNQTLSPRHQKEHNHQNDPRKGISPHVLKCTRYNGRLYQMGECRVLHYYA